MQTHYVGQMNRTAYGRGLRASVLLPLPISIVSNSGINHESKQAIIQFLPMPRFYLINLRRKSQEQRCPAAPPGKDVGVGPGCPTALCCLPALLIRQQELQHGRETGAAFPPECFSKHNSCSIYTEVPETNSIPAASKACC